MKNKIWSVVGKIGPAASTIASLIFGTALVYAAAPAAPSPVQSTQQLEDVLCTFIIYFFWIIITLSIIMVLYAAFIYATAGDNTEKTTGARRTLTYAAIGIAIALLAIGFPKIVGSVFPNLTGSPLEPQCTTPL